jgi:hypothetical protein
METVDVVRDILGRISKGFTGKVITNNIDGTSTITTCNTMWLQNGFTVTIAGSPYVIVDFLRNEWIKVEGTVPTGALTFDIYPLTYVHGTTLKAKEDWTAPLGTENLFSRTPFAWLKEIIGDRYPGPGSDSSLSRKTAIRLFFLSTTKVTDPTADQYRNVINQMSYLAKQFVAECNRSTWQIQRIDEEYEIKNLVNFGVYVADKGNTKSIFNDELSGVELAITLPILKEACIRC